MNEKNHQLTPFQWKVLKAATQIPIGETRSYKWIAQKIGSPQAVRAVGQALRRNPFPLLIPCHRVIKADGTLGAYSGRYDNKKKRLLEIERRIAASLQGKTK